MALCPFCRKRNSSPMAECPDSECKLCGGASARLASMVAGAAAKIPEEWESFSISTNIPRKMMAAEEIVWDLGLGRSIKDDFNGRIAGGLIAATGLDYSVLRADGKITFDFEKNEARLENADVFVFGRYKKTKPGVSQSEWTCKSCGGKGCAACDFAGKMYASVEETLAKEAKRVFSAADAELHSSGREDVDVTNLAGRPFVLEVRKPGKCRQDLALLADEINKNGEGVEVGGLKYVSNSAVALVSDSHFDKSYEAEVEVEGGLAKGDIEKIMRLSGAMLEQRTPERVKHRRSDLVRKRRILALTLVSENPLRLVIKSEAGTYIKEFVNGDNGRTKPSVSSAINRNAKCIKLSVRGIDDDFLREVIGG